MNKTSWIILAIVVIILVIVLATGGSEEDTNLIDDVTTEETEDDNNTGTTPAPAFASSDQAVVDGKVVVESVSLPVDGFVVVHRTDVDGAPVVPASIGHAFVEAGTATNVVIDLDEEVVAGEKLVLMLHFDTNQNGVYEFGEGSTDVDTPVAVEGAVVATTITVLEAEAE